MLSRVAESLYWMNRYVERAEHTARFSDVYRRLILDLPIGAAEGWERLVEAMGDGQAFSARFDQATESAVTAFLTFDHDNPNSILSCLATAKDNARSVRDSITPDVWEQINGLYGIVRAASSARLDNPHDLFSKIKLGSHLISGLIDASLSHDGGWYFGQIGRLQERADKTLRILDSTTGGIAASLDAGTVYANEIHWSAILRSASAFEMYRRRNGRIEPHRIVGFLLLDDEFPRSVGYCLGRIGDALMALSGSPSAVDDSNQDLSQTLAELNSAIFMCENEPIFFQEMINYGLHETIGAILSELNRFGETLSDRYFSLERAD